MRENVFRLALEPKNLFMGISRKMIREGGGGNANFVNFLHWAKKLELFSNVSFLQMLKNLQNEKKLQRWFLSFRRKNLLCWVGVER